MRSKLSPFNTIGLLRPSYPSPTSVFSSSLLSHQSRTPIFFPTSGLARTALCYCLIVCISHDHTHRTHGLFVVDDVLHGQMYERGFCLPVKLHESIPLIVPSLPYLVDHTLKLVRDVPPNTTTNRETQRSGSSHARLCVRALCSQLTSHREPNKLLSPEIQLGEGGYRWLWCVVTISWSY